MSAHAVAILLAIVQSTTALQFAKHEQSTERAECNATVAYTFLAREGLPLWPVWESYFRGCPAGSFTVLVHTQTPGAANVVSSLGGEELPTSDVLLGDLRFSYRNVDAMLNLFGGVQARGAAPNGCTPQWVHVSSESCAPVEPCQKVHEHLQQYPSESFVYRLPTKPPSNDTVLKSLQWVTLASEHAFALYERRDAMRDRWSGYSKTDYWGGHFVTIGGVNYSGAVEEFVWPYELEMIGAKMHGKKGLTKAGWQKLPNGARSGHPVEYSTASETWDAISWARRSRHLFVRKFTDSTEVMSTLIMNFDIAEKAISLVPSVNESMASWAGPI